MIIRERITEEQLREAVRRWREKRDLPLIPPARRRRNEVVHERMMTIERNIRADAELSGAAHHYDDRVFMRDLILRYKVATTLLVVMGVVHPEDWETIYQFAEDYLKIIGIEIIPDDTNT